MFKTTYKKNGINVATISMFKTGKIGAVHIFNPFSHGGRGVNVILNVYHGSTGV